jgi:hypothetical protein
VADIDGVAELLAALEIVEAEATGKAAHAAAANLVLGTARQLAPKGPTGKLARSGRASGTKREGVVRFGGAAVPWAAAAHFGHPPPRRQGGFMRPNPFAYEAGDRRADDVLAVFDAATDRGLRRAGLS